LISRVDKFFTTPADIFHDNNEPETANPVHQRQNISNEQKGKSINTDELCD